MHVFLLAVITAPTQAPPPQVTVSHATASVSLRVPVVAPVAAASYSSVSARFSFLNKPDSES